MKLLIIRHGDPDYSIDSLTPTGWKEAAILAQRISKLDVKAFYVSPLGRAQDTARATLEAMGRTAQTLPWLREFAPPKHNYQDPNTPHLWDWLPQVWTADPLLYDSVRWAENAFYAQVGAGDEAQWVADGLDALLARHGYVRQGKLYRAEQPNEDTVVLFCHFGVECVMLGHLLGLSPVAMWHNFCAAPTSVTTLTTEERRDGIASFRMSAFGDTSHLYAAGREPSFSARFCEMYSNTDQRHD